MAFQLSPTAICQPKSQLKPRLRCKGKGKVRQSVQVSLRRVWPPLPRKARLIGWSEEIALYDRQIRLWGVKAQER